MVYKLKIQATKENHCFSINQVKEKEHDKVEAILDTCKNTKDNSKKDYLVIEGLYDLLYLEVETYLENATRDIEIIFKELVIHKINNMELEVEYHFMKFQQKCPKLSFKTFRKDLREIKKKLINSHPLLQQTFVLNSVIEDFYAYLYRNFIIDIIEIDALTKEVKWKEIDFNDMHNPIYVAEAKFKNIGNLIIIEPNLPTHFSNFKMKHDIRALEIEAATIKIHEHIYYYKPKEAIEYAIMEIKKLQEKYNEKINFLKSLGAE